MKISLLTFINFALFIAIILTSLLLIDLRSNSQKKFNSLSMLDKQIKENEKKYLDEKKIFLDSRDHLHILECAQERDLNVAIIRESTYEEK